MVAASFLTVAVMHLLVWSRRPNFGKHLLFALAAAFAGGNAIAEAWIYRAATIEAVLPALRWYAAMSGVWALATIWFIVSYSRLRRLGHCLAILLSIELVVALIVNFVSPTGFIYTEITGLRRIELPWGEVFSLAEGIHRSWPLATEVTLLLAIVMVIDGSRRFLRAGQPRRALLFGSSLILFIVLFASHATMVDMGILNSPYLSTYGFLGVVLVISMDMAGDVVRASVLSQEVQRKDAEMRAAVDEERNRIAGDLHDSVTQTLFSTAAIADALPDVWDRYPDEARRGLEDLRQLTKGALAEMRALLLELHPSALLEKQLGELLKQLADATVARTRIPVTAEVHDDRKLPDQIQVALYRAAQEALNNAIKHAKAKSIKLSLSWHADTLTLTVTDDGHGFDLTSVESGHLGLSIMRQRIRSVGGIVDVETKVGGGTSIRVVWRDDRQGDSND